jgi:hypothetical protein
MYQQIEKNSHILVSKKSLIKVASAVMLTTASLVMIITETAQAGELFRSQQTLRRQTGLGGRRISKSTKAVKSLNNVRMTKTLDFSQSSPYEARMVAYNTAMRKYDKDYAKWEYKTDQMQAKLDRKADKEKLRDDQKKKKEQEKLAKVHAREQERLDRKNRKTDKNSSASFLTRAFGGGAKDKDESKTVIQDEKAKKAEAFFGSVDSETPAIAATPEATKPKLSFWQRLSRALFGGK